MRCQESSGPALIGTGTRKLLTLTFGSVALPVLLLSVSLVQVAQTADGVDADLWKDGLFKSKVTRYLCFTRSFSKENVSLLVLFHLLSGHKSCTCLYEISSCFCWGLFSCHTNLSVVLLNWVELAANSVFHLLRVLLTMYSEFHEIVLSKGDREISPTALICLPFLQVTNHRQYGCENIPVELDVKLTNKWEHS